MPRQRFIWPDLWEDEDFGHLSSDERILFVAMFSLADDEGRLSASPANLRALAFRFDDLTLSQVREMRDHIVATMRHVHMYEVDGKEYIELTSWQRRQHPKYPQPSRIPAPTLPSAQDDEARIGHPEALGERSGNVADSKEERSSVGWVGLGRDNTPLPPVDTGGLGDGIHDDQEDPVEETQPDTAPSEPGPQKARNLAMADPETRRVVRSIGEALDGAGITARPSRWYPAACKVVYHMLWSGARSVPAGSIVSAAQWCVDPERRRYHVTKLTAASRIPEAVAAWQARDRVTPPKRRSRYLTPNELGLMPPEPASTGPPRPPSLVTAKATGGRSDGDGS